MFWYFFTVPYISSPMQKREEKKTKLCVINYTFTDNEMKMNSFVILPKSLSDQSMCVCMQFSDGCFHRHNYNKRAHNFLCHSHSSRFSHNLFVCILCAVYAMSADADERARALVNVRRDGLSGTCVRNWRINGIRAETCEHKWKCDKT